MQVNLGQIWMKNQTKEELKGPNPVSQASPLKSCTHASLPHALQPPPPRIEKPWRRCPSHRCLHLSLHWSLRRDPKWRNPSLNSPTLIRRLLSLTQSAPFRHHLLPPPPSRPKRSPWKCLRKNHSVYRSKLLLRSHPCTVVSFPKWNCCNYEFAWSCEVIIVHLHIAQ